MSRFFKFLIMVAAIANLILLLSFDGQLPSFVRIPFLPSAEEAEETEAVKPVPEETLPEKEEAAEPETTVETAMAEPEEEVQEEAGEETEEEAQEEETLPECRVISEYGSNVRSGPGPDYEVVTAFPYDTVLVITGEPEIGWFPIRAEDGTEGYIFETQIELPEGYAYTTEEGLY